MGGVVDRRKFWTYPLLFKGHGFLFFGGDKFGFELVKEISPTGAGQNSSKGYRQYGNAEGKDHLTMFPRFLVSAIRF